ncbi:MAG: DUF4410 domain-containing protein [Deltaproteobacteria bacterium]|nr:DUF4410 domain-containing protein [Deltaproteobacteria bacterium]MBI3390186.1 DUF4410 domain-containing protein [Deltaproteobacteria bacterium]
MEPRSRLALCLFALLAAAGCASTKVTNREQLVTGKIPRPGNIWVYDFAATAADIPAGSAFAGQATDASQTPEQLATGRQLGAEIAGQLVEQINSMGMPAARAGAGTTVQINDMVIRGYLVSVTEGSTAERVAIGFGAGASALKTAVEGFQMTAQGLRKLGSGEVDAGGGKSPGAALGVVGLIATANPAGLIIGTGVKAYGEMSGSSKVEGRAKATAKEIADVLKQRFQQQGWIN